ncbi:MAG: adenylate/guanylate cyclase domain-containing protein, partial [Spirochaetia bacterium]|nr:adenylate/guanylate cyclase domain-containing protein [Spirochaetia bacterium]
TVGAFRLSPGESAAFSFELVSEEPVQLLCPELHAQAKIQPHGARHDGPWIVDMDLTDRGFSPDLREVGPGPVEVRVRNATGRVVGVAGLRKKKEQFQQARSAVTFKPHPWLTARDLLNHQTFRDLFKAQDLDPNLRLNLKSLTLLFTDLKGSTEMYDRAGDFHAYRVVQEHFEILTQVVRRRHGAMIKTMGDAIMAAFSVPTDAVQAAVDMKKAIEEKNIHWKKDGYDMGLKVGLHEGSALAVNADDRLDYFGQTVNIAARVQGLSGAGEIWLTENVYDSSGVSDILRAGNFSVRKQSALLKGVGKPVTVLQCRQAGSEPSLGTVKLVRVKPGQKKARVKIRKIANKKTVRKKR